MPIILNDLLNSKGAASAAPTVSYNPKFFSDKLTGTGSKLGILNSKQDPAHISHTERNDNVSVMQMTKLIRGSFTNGQAKISGYPFYQLVIDVWKNLARVPLPDTNEMTKVGEIKNNTSSQTASIYIGMLPHSLIIEEVERTNGTTKRTLHTCYHVQIWIIQDGTLTKTDGIHNTIEGMPYGFTAQNHFSATEEKLRQATEQASCLSYFTTRPATAFEIMNDIRRSFTIYNPSVIKYTVDVNQKAFDKFIDNYSLYEGICKQSETWQSNIDKMLDFAVDGVSAAIGKSSQSTCLNALNKNLHHLETYNVPLDLYRNIYTSITNKFNTALATTLCKQNLNLLLSDTLNNLYNNKSQLTCIPTPKTPVNINKKFSKEQVNAITTTEPLVLVQAGAGTGKSTVILERINYMIACGVKPEDITVLSFTNAAADHISDCCKNVHSMTIASMIHTIYATNFPTHELSSIETILNSVDIYFPGDNFADEFIQRLKLLKDGKRDGVTRMNNFIEANYDNVMRVLDTIRQTSLELEIIICYQKIDTLTEPKEVQSKFLIIDEVQDNSIFEFIYSLKYVDKHQESLFMVGRLQLLTLNPTNCRKLAFTKYEPHIYRKMYGSR